MYRYKLYNSDDMEKLERELVNYKQMLKNIRFANEVSYSPEANSEYSDLFFKFSKLKGEMKRMEGNYQKRIDQYQQDEQFLSSRMNSFSDTLSKLKKDVKKMKDNINQIHFTELLEKMNQMISKQDEQLMETKIKYELLKEEVTQLKDYIKYNTQTPEPTNQTPEPTDQQVTTKKSEFRQLQNMLHTSSYIQEVAPKQDNMMNTQRFSRPNPKIQSTSPRLHTNSQMRQGKNTFYNPQNELNKNIITRVTSSRNNEGKKKVKSTVEEDSLITVNENTSPPAKDDSYIEQSLKKTETTEVDLKEKEAHELNIETDSNTDIELSNKEEKFPERFIGYLPYEANNQIVNTEEEKPNSKQEIDDDQHDKNNKKMELSSLFSIFKKN